MHVLPQQCCLAEGGSVLEAEFLDEAVAVRDSKDRQGPALNVHAGGVGRLRGLGQGWRV
jgi:hypothetical protein